MSRCEWQLLAVMKMISSFTSGDIKSKLRTAWDIVAPNKSNSISHKEVSILLSPSCDSKFEFVGVSDPHQQPLSDRSSSYSGGCHAVSSRVWQGVNGYFPTKP
jgi:hypothetical protein